MDRVILHCDLNSFYASVELLDHPELKKLPVAVCGDPSSRHGIILAKNDPAKGFTTGFTGSTPGRSTPSTTSTPTWWSPSALMRAGWT